MNVDFSVTLRIYSSKLTSNEVSRRLNLVPTRVAEKGTALHKSQKKRDDTLWLLENKLSKQKTMDEHMEYILSLIEEKKTELIYLSDNECSIDLFCFFSTDNGQGSIILNHDLLIRLSALPIDVVFDIYA